MIPVVIQMGQRERLVLTTIISRDGECIRIEKEVYEDGGWRSYGAGQETVQVPARAFCDLAAVFAREWDALVTERIAKANANWSVSQKEGGK